MPNQNQNQNLKNMEREASQSPDYDRSDQSLHRQEIEKGSKGDLQKQGQGQKSGAGRRDDK